MIPLVAAAGVALAASASATSPSPSPGSTELPRGLEPTDVTPGVAGFLATAFVVVLSIFLILNLVARMRRMRHRAALEEAREQAARDGGPTEALEGAGATAELSHGHPVVVGEAREGGLADSRPDPRPEPVDHRGGAGAAGRAAPDEPDAPPRRG